MPIKYADLLEALDFVSFGAPSEHQAFVCLDTGAIYWVSANDPIEEEALPEDLETSDRYLAIPHKNDLALGSRLALEFAAQHLPDQFEAVVSIFRHRGAYAQFKALLSAAGCLEKWYVYEAEAVESALRRWCEANEIQLDENGARQPSERRHET